MFEIPDLRSLQSAWKQPFWTFPSNLGFLSCSNWWGFVPADHGQRSVATRRRKWQGTQCVAQEEHADFPQKGSSQGRNRHLPRLGTDIKQNHINFTLDALKCWVQGKVHSQRFQSKSNLAMSLLLFLGFPSRRPPPAPHNSFNTPSFPVSPVVLGFSFVKQVDLLYPHFPPPAACWSSPFFLD